MWGCECIWFGTVCPLGSLSRRQIERTLGIQILIIIVLCDDFCATLLVHSSAQVLSVIMLSHCLEISLCLHCLSARDSALTVSFHKRISYNSEVFCLAFILFTSFRVRDYWQLYFYYFLKVGSFKTRLRNFKFSSRSTREKLLFCSSVS